VSFATLRKHKRLSYNKGNWSTSDDMKKKSSKPSQDFTCEEFEFSDDPLPCEGSTADIADGCDYDELIDHDTCADLNYGPSFCEENCTDADDAHLDMNEDYCEVWEDEQDSDMEDAPSHPDVVTENNSKAGAISVWIIGFIMKMQKRHVLSDSALNCLIKFIYASLVVLSMFSPSILAISKAFPSSLYKLRKRSLSNEQFTKFTVCTKCNKLYFNHDCVSHNGNQLESKKCDNKEFPGSRNNVCSQLLMKNVHYASGKSFFLSF
jgi:hypothetical protein